MSTRNRYKAWCEVCNKRVLALEGITNYVHGRWVTKHVKCVKSTGLNRAIIPRINEIDDTQKYVDPQLTLRF